MPPPDRPGSPTRADVDARLRDTFLALNQIAASLALIERSCDRAMTLPVADEAGLDSAVALRTARSHAQVTLERIGNVSETLTTVLRYLSQQKSQPHEGCSCLALAGE
jgi:hypothetical protein